MWKSGCPGCFYKEKIYDTIVVATVVALILGTNIIVLYGFDEAVLPGDLDLMKVGTVFRHLQTVGAV